MYRINRWLACLFLLITPIAAQNRSGGPQGTISRKILDAATKGAVEYANIVLNNATDSSQVTGTISQSDGSFRLENLRPGKYYVEVYFLGYQTQHINDVQISRRNPTVDVGNILIRQSTVSMNAVEVEGEKAPISYQIDKKVINVERQLTATSGSAVDVLENVPSIRVDIEGNVCLRGSGSFRVLIDGRPTILDASDALQQIPASTIANIEIITNPSAKFDPEGTAGIINIILKKNRKSGRSGFANVNAGLDDKYGIDGTVEYKTERYSTVLSVDYNRRNYSGNDIDENRTTRDGVTSFLYSEGESQRGRINMGLRAGFDYFLTSDDILSFGARVGDRTSDRDASQEYDEWTSLAPEPVIYTNSTERERSGYFYAIHSNYQHKFGMKGHELSARLSWNYRESDEMSSNALLNNAAEITEGRRTTENGPSSDFSSRLDYERPLSETSKMEFGYTTDVDNSTDNTALFEFDTDVNDYVEQTAFNNYSKYKRSIHAVYGMFAGEYKSLGVQFGLRGEYTGREIFYEDSNDPFKIDRWDYFPTIHSSFKFPGGQQMMASYTRRIDRPRGWSLEPFETWIDAYNIRIGNPALQPEYIDSYELGMQTYFGKNLFSVETYFRQTNNKIERIRSVYADNITLHTTRNVGKDYALGSEFLLNLDVTKKWNVNLIGNLYNYRVEGTLFDESFDRESFNWGSRISNSIKITRDFQLQVDGSYRSRSVSSQRRESGFFMVNSALRYEFIQKQVIATLQIRDLFDSASRESVSEGPGFYNFSSWNRQSPMVMLNVRFNFNNNKPERRNQNQGEMDADDDF